MDKLSGFARVPDVQAAGGPAPPPWAPLRVGADAHRQPPPAVPPPLPQPRSLGDGTGDENEQKRARATLQRAGPSFGRRCLYMEYQEVPGRNWMSIYRMHVLPWRG